MNNIESTIAKVIIQYVKPTAEKHHMFPLNYYWRPDLLTRMCKLFHDGKINSTRMRRWVEERVGEKELESNLSLSTDTCKALDEMEIIALEKC